MRCLTLVFIGASLVALLPPAADAVSVELVTVGDPANPGRLIEDRMVGRVDYVYGMAKFEVTNGGSYGEDNGAYMRSLIASIYWNERPGDHDFNDGTPGFRVALVPEPTSIVWALLAFLATLPAGHGWQRRGPRRAQTN